MTETSPLTHISDPGDPPEYAIQTVGTAILHTDVPLKKTCTQFWCQHVQKK